MSQEEVIKVLLRENKPMFAREIREKMGENKHSLTLVINSLTRLKQHGEVQVRLKRDFERSNGRKISIFYLTKRQKQGYTLED